MTQGNNPFSCRFQSRNNRNTDGLTRTEVLRLFLGFFLTGRLR
jgi:hypothetical protein